MCNDDNDGNNNSADDNPNGNVPNEKLTREQLDDLPKEKKLGRFKHIGKTIRIFEILGGFSTGKPMALFERLYEMDAEEASHIADKDKVGSAFTAEGNEKKYRSWRMIHTEKIRCGQASISTLEAKRLYDEVVATLGPEVAQLFDPDEIATLHPQKIIGRILTAGVGLSHPLQNPILLLRVLAELGIDPAPIITIANTQRLRMTDQGDGRSDGLELIRKLPVIKVNEQFVLDIALTNARHKDIIVFEYANDEVAKPGDNNPTLALPMPYLQFDTDAILITKEDESPLVAGKALGQFGFCVIAAPKAAEGKPGLRQKLGIDPEAEKWNTEDMHRLTAALRKYLAKDKSEISIALLDYDKRPE